MNLNKQSISLCIKCLLIGLCLGVAITVALVIFLKGENSPFGDLSYQNERTIDLPLNQKAKKQAKDHAAADTVIEDPNKFDFYTILPEADLPKEEETPKAIDDPIALPSASEPSNNTVSDDTAEPNDAKPNDAKPNDAAASSSPTKPANANDTKKVGKPNAQAESNQSGAKQFFLQIGAFSKQDDATSLKTKLALHGFESSVQSIDISDKGLMHRVRIGPLRDLETIRKMRNDLQSNGFSSDLIRQSSDN